MSQFRYRLQPLLNEKLALKGDAEEALAKRQAELRAEQEKLETLNHRVDALCGRKSAFRANLLAGSAAGGIDGMDAQLRRDYVRGLDQDIEEARDAVLSQKTVIDGCVEHVAAARRELAGRTREVEVLKKHRERLEQRFLRELERKDALEQDEIGNVLYMSRRR
jgi:flagellar biosynthesis chaperone FliJ